MNQKLKRFSALFLAFVMIISMSIHGIAASTESDTPLSKESQTQQETTIPTLPSSETDYTKDTDITETTSEISASTEQRDEKEASVFSDTTAQKNLEAEVKQDTAGFQIENGKVVFYLFANDNLTQVTNAAVNLADKTSFTTPEGISYSFNKGIYYFSQDGSLNENAAGVGQYRILTVNSSFIQTKEETLLLKRGAVTSSQNTYTSGITLFTGADGGKIYHNGTTYSGYALDGSGTMYSVKSGTYDAKFTGIMKSSFVSVPEAKLLTANNCYYKKGTPTTAIVENHFYKKGVLQSSYTGWKKLNDDIYYVKKGKTVTGWKYLKNYSGGKETYKYYFNDNGKLVTDLFQKFGSSYKKKQLKIKVNLTTHNITVYLYDSKKNSYDIPAKTWVCSTARDGKSTKVGNWSLSKGTARKWFIYKKSNPYHYYQWGVHIAGISSWFHSEMYSGTSNRKLYAWAYNGLGTDQTTTCIRSQAGNAKLIYDIAKTNPHRVPVQIYRSSNKGPFGQIKLKHTTGKIPSNQKYDPTDPALQKK